MKILKYTLIGIGSLIILLLVTALFVDKNYTVEREILIDRSSEEVFDYIKYLKNQDNYSIWATMDPDMKKEFRGTDGTVGFVSAWESEIAGKGEQEIVNIVEGERIDFELRFIEPFSSISPAFMSAEPVSENETLVKWGFNGRMDYPFNISLLFMNMEEMIGNDLQTGLVNLKNLLEKEKSTTQNTETNGYD